ncbi:ATP-binding protein [Nocardia brasiliensis]|uniref:histidine kinase n=1 Tax=Nocardia brasiliensis (strain ATCC 700358 / HUJEG-1) TaxID=1133849 RepID=K0EUM2_NOCB7|nr:sensor histidine kinase [Nocardia brasiliensis]AFU01222.1 histidine kinase [Nocardia brasiliensis ATCC 700358]OCF86580.1 histidine kinase [Nocardia brasiliensis]
MNQDIAVVLAWILAAALLVAIAVALYAFQYAKQQRARAEALAREQRAVDETVERFATNTMPAVTESIRRFDTQPPTVEVPPGLENSRLAQVLRWIAERYADDLSLLRSETREQANHEAQQAIGAAEGKVREEVSAASRQATSAAVRSFGTSVVSLGADVSQVVSSALREHRNDEVYETLTRIDHTVQQMIRQAQSYVIVCGGLPGRRWPAQSLTDVVGGAIGRVRDYLRVRPNQLDRVVISRAVEPLVHTLATLLDNALRYSPPTSFVDVSFQEGHHGVTVIIDDAGVRMNAEQMEEARQVLAHERSVDIHQLGPSPKVGFPGIAALARRYGFTVYIDGPNVYGGMRAMVYIPEALLMTQQPGQDVVPAHEQPAAEVAPPPAPAPVPAAREPQREEPSESEQFAVHEITSGGLPKRRRRTVALAPVGPRTEPGLARPDVAAAWHTGSQSGRAAATDHSEHTEGMTS